MAPFIRYEPLGKVYKCKICETILFEDESDWYNEIIGYPDLLDCECCPWCIASVIDSAFYCHSLKHIFTMIARLENSFLRHQAKYGLGGSIIDHGLKDFLDNPSLDLFRIVVNNNLLTRKYAVTYGDIRIMGFEGIFCHLGSRIESSSAEKYDIIFNEYYRGV